MERDIRAGFEEQMAFDPLMTNPFLKRACLLSP